MRFSCKSCQATFQTATAAPASQSFRCPSCNGEMAAAAEVVDLWQDRIPTRRYDLDDLRARLDAEREEFAHCAGPGWARIRFWFAAVQGRQVGPLSAAGIAGLRARGQLSPASLVWREGWPSWVAAEAVPELRATLGLPEETPGRPFPVQPSAPTPPPFDSTYAAARATAESELFLDPLLPGDKTEPAARIPELLSSRATGDAGSALPAPHGPAVPPSASPTPLAQPLPERPGALGPEPSAAPPAIAQAVAPAAAAPAAAAPAAAAPAPAAPEGAAADSSSPALVARMGIIVPPAAAGPAASPIAGEPSSRPPGGPSLVPPPPVEPPALPLADEAELERAASAVFAQAREGELAAEATDPGAGPALAARTDGERERSPGAASDAAGAARAEARSPGEARCVDAVAAAMQPGAAAGDEARAARATSGAAAPSDPSGAGAPLQMIDLSATGPADEAAPPRRSRPPSQQQWFSSPEARPETEPRSPLVLGAALALALLVLWLLMRSR